MTFISKLLLTPVARSFINSHEKSFDASYEQFFQTDESYMISTISKSADIEPVTVTFSSSILVPLFSTVKLKLNSSPSITESGPSLVILTPGTAFLILTDLSAASS